MPYSGMPGHHYLLAPKKARANNRMGASGSGGRTLEQLRNAAGARVHDKSGALIGNGGTSDGKTGGRMGGSRIGNAIQTFPPCRIC